MVPSIGLLVVGLAGVISEIGAQERKPILCLPGSNTVLSRHANFELVRYRLWPPVAACLLLLLLAANWESVLNFGGDYLVCSQPPRQADIILVLGGDFFGPRVVTAADLAVQGYAPLVLISGPSHNGQPEGELAIRFLESKGYPARLFDLFGHHARSTIAEAKALRPELARRGIK